MSKGRKDRSALLLVAKNHIKRSVKRDGVEIYMRRKVPVKVYLKRAKGALSEAYVSGGEADLNVYSANFSKSTV